MKTDLSILPRVKDVYITMLPGNNFKDVANKAKELVQSGFNPTMFSNFIRLLNFRGPVKILA